MPKSYHDPRKPKQSIGRKRLLLWGGLAVALFIIGLLVGQFKTGEAPLSTALVADTPEKAQRAVILYFASADGQTLVAEPRKINECLQDEDCLRDTVQLLIAGSESGLAPILPRQVVLRGVAVADSLVKVDFSRELISAHPGGTQSELLTIYGLADTLSANFPHLRQLQILVEGAAVATLKGHVDLRQPIYADFRLVQKGLAPTGKMISLPAGGDE